MGNPTITQNVHRGREGINGCVQMLIYIWIRLRLDLFDTTIPYGIPLIAIFVGNTSENIRNHMKVDIYHVTNSAYIISNEIQ